MPPALRQPDVMQAGSVAVRWRHVNSDWVVL